MSIVNIFWKIYKKITVADSILFKHSRAEDEDYINHFDEPKDDIERAYYQYLCQKWMDNNSFKYFLANVVALISIAFTERRYYRLGKEAIFEKNYDAVLTQDHIQKFIPSDFEGCFIFQDFNKGSLKKEDKEFINEIKRRYPFAFYFRFKCNSRIAAYSDLLNRYNPKVVFCSAEYSFTSSILTMYCEMHNVDHINIMHGEKLFMAREAFSRFTKFYVWDSFYIKLFKSLRADQTEYQISPINTHPGNAKSKGNSFVYYLGSENRERLTKIKHNLEELGSDYYVRPHPIYETTEVRQIFDNEHIENAREVDIWDSIGKAGTIISLYSTVLYQAYLVGADILIDDVSDHKLYEELFERDYIMLNKPHKLLSQELRKMGEFGNRTDSSKIDSTW